MSETAPQDSQKTAQMKVLALYIGFLVVILFQFPLNVTIQAISIILFFALLAIIKFIRSENDKESLLYNHATFLSRTLWMWSFLLGIGLAFAGIYMSKAVPFEQLGTLSEDLMARKTDSPLIQSMVPMALGGLAPSTIYIIYRYIKGFVYAVQQQGLKNPKRFF